MGLSPRSSGRPHGLGSARAWGSAPRSWRRSAPAGEGRQLGGGGGPSHRATGLGGVVVRGPCESVRAPVDDAQGEARVTGAAAAVTELQGRRVELKVGGRSPAPYTLGPSLAATPRGPSEGDQRRAPGTPDAPGVVLTQPRCACSVAPESATVDGARDSIGPFGVQVVPQRAVRRPRHRTSCDGPPTLRRTFWGPWTPVHGSFLLQGRRRVVNPAACLLCDEVPRVRRGRCAHHGRPRYGIGVVFCTRAGPLA